MAWSYDPKTRSTGEPAGIIPRVRLEEAVVALYDGGIRNRRLITDALIALTSLSGDEVRFNVNLAIPLEQHIASTDQDELEPQFSGCLGRT